MSLLSNYHINLCLKFLLQYSYYIDGSCIKPKELSNEQWQRETVEYGILSPTKQITISKRLPGRAHILKAELTALHHIHRIINE